MKAGKIFSFASFSLQRSFSLRAYMTRAGEIMPRQRVEKRPVKPDVSFQTLRRGVCNARLPSLIGSSTYSLEPKMGIGKLIEEVAGAVAAEDAVEAVDPKAGFLTKAAAAVAGFEGVNKLTDVLQEKEQASNADNSSN
ncbi:hypothetical protein [Rhizobium sp. P38BS-XIX]|uniref:hypothetical protein n=1 Tax=Rhizobium sp. P38BS-XIX TaxID=2726740 RepID=UPI001FF02E2D|nr:hypothetical protein [Rhizobium sp. P38BS-XIX]